jgi:hypothetical protein
MPKTRSKKKMTWDNFLDSQKPGDVYVDQHGHVCQVVAVSGPKLSPGALRRLRRIALQLNAAAEPR